MSPLTWIGTCRNPVDGKHYVISYNDCCGKNACGRCFCHRNEGDKPVYVPPKSNDIDWCMGQRRRDLQLDRGDRDRRLHGEGVSRLAALAACACLVAATARARIRA